MSKVEEATIPLCPEHRAPLMLTMLFSGAEYYCLEGGCKFGMFGPQLHEPNTPELEEQHASFTAEWREVAPKLLTGGVMKTDCRDKGGMCGQGEPHLYHCTQEERDQHHWALGYLSGRARRAVAD